MDKIEIGGIGIFIFLGMLFMMVLGCFYIISAGERGVLLTWGRPSQYPIDEGLHFKIPIAQSVEKMSIRTLKYEAEAAAASSDLQTITAKIVTNYRLVPEKVPEIYTKLGKSYEDTIIKPMEQEAVKATTARFTAEELITKREDVRTQIRQLLSDRLADRGIIVEEVSITDFDFSESFNQAIEAKVTAEQLKLKADRDLQRIEVEAQQAQAVADGKKMAAIKEAEGQAQAISIINAQLATSPLYIDYLKVKEWDGVLPKVVGGATPMMDISGLIQTEEEEYPRGIAVINQG